MKKILFITHSAELSGGAELEFQRFLTLIKREYEGINVECLVPEGPAVKILKKYSSRLGTYKYGFLPVVYISVIDYLKYLYISFRQLKDISSFVSGKSYDLCVLNVAVLIIPAIYLKLKGYKVVFLIKEKVEPKIVRYLLYKLISFSSVFIFFNSSKIKDEFIKFTSNYNVMHLYTSIFNSIQGIEPDSVKYVPNGNLPIDKHKLNILCVGDIIKRKNQSMILEASGLLRKDIDIFVHFVGKYDIKDSYYITCQEIIANNSLNENIKFYGRLNHQEMYHLLSNIDIVIISSLSEGIPYFLFDALKYGKILISTNVGGISEIITNNKNGFLIPVNHNELMRMIKWVYKNKNNLEHISNNAKQTFNNYLNSKDQMKIMINKLIELSII